MKSMTAEQRNHMQAKADEMGINIRKREEK